MVFWKHTDTLGSSLKVDFTYKHAYVNFQRLSSSDLGTSLY